MASKHVEAAVEDFLAAHWTLCPVILENSKGETPKDGSPFLLVQFPVATVRRLTASAPAVYREDGAARILINVERNEGATKMRGWGEELAGLFRYAVFDGVRCQAPSEPVTDDRSDQGNFYVGTMSVPFWRTFRD